MKKRITALCFTMLLVFALAGCRHTDSTYSPYALSDNWAYLETGETASADVFFICPTVYGGNENSFNMPLDDEASKADFLGATNMEKGFTTKTPVFLLPIIGRWDFLAIPFRLQSGNPVWKSPTRM